MQLHKITEKNLFERMNQRMFAVYGNDVAQFQWECVYIEDDPKTGKLKTATNAKLTQKVDSMALHDCR